MTALGCGLLVGLERERRKGEGPARLPAGIRTFALTAVAGAMARSVNEPWLVVTAALVIGAMSAVATFKRQTHDPGLTTALALQVTYLLGVLSVTAPLMAASSAVVVTILLAARGSLHHFSTTLLTDHELRDGLLLAAVGLIAIPLAPDTPLNAWLTTTPRQVVELVLIFMSLQAMCYVAHRVAGERFGIVLSGLLGGFVSSTATITAFGTRARSSGQLSSTYVAGALASSIATALLLLTVTVTVHAPALAVLGWPLLSGLVTAILAALVGFLQRKEEPTPSPPPGRAFNLLYAIGFALALTGTSAVLSLALQTYGQTAANLTALLGGLLDVHASAASTLSLGATARLPLNALALPVLLAWSANTGGKLVGAWVAGGPRYALSLVVGLTAPVGAAWLALHFE